MAQFIDKDALVAEIEKRIEAHKETLKNCDSNISEIVLKGSMSAYQSLLHFLDTIEVKEIDLELITHWFDHIAQIADDRKTANGTVMEDWAALDEIKCLAKTSSEFVKMHYKAQKGE